MPSTVFYFFTATLLYVTCAIYATYPTPRAVSTRIKHFLRDLDLD
jgi:hypothetical protein